MTFLIFKHLPFLCYRDRVKENGRFYRVFQAMNNLDKSQSRKASPNAMLVYEAVSKFEEDEDVLETKMSG
jgi:hypothetical protein